MMVIEYAQSPATFQPGPLMRYALPFVLLAAPLARSSDP